MLYVSSEIHLTPATDIMKLKTLKGLALQDILTQVHLYVHRGGFSFVNIHPLICSYINIMFSSAVKIEQNTRHG